MGLCRLPYERQLGTWNRFLPPNEFRQAHTVKRATREGGHFASGLVEALANNSNHGARADRHRNRPGRIAASLPEHRQAGPAASSSKSERVGNREVPRGRSENCVEGGQVDAESLEGAGLINGSVGKYV